MSRLAEVLNATLSASNFNASAPSGLLAELPEDAAQASFQALFAQELANPVAATLPASAGSALPRTETGDTETKEQGEGKVFEAAIPNAAEVLPWLPLPVPAALQPKEAGIPVAAARQTAVLGANSAPAADTAGLAPPPLVVAASAKALGPEAGIPSTPGTTPPLIDAKTAATSRSAWAAPVVEFAAESGARPTPQASAASPSGSALNAGQIAAGAIAMPSGLPAPAPAAASTAISTPFSAPAWREDFTQQVVMIAKTEVSSAELKLNPPQLGPIEISLQIKKDVAEASFAAASAPVREAIEASIPRLKEMFAEAGITLGNTSVSHQFGEARQTFAESESQSREGRGGGEGNQLQANSEEIKTAVMRRRSYGMVDTFA